MSAGADELARIARLTRCERQVALAIATGLTNKETANLPGYKRSIKTVDKYIERIREKLEMPFFNRVLVCRMFIRNGLMQP